LQTMPEAAEFRMVNTDPDAPGIYDPPVRVVIRQEPSHGREPSGSVQPTPTNSSRSSHLTPQSAIAGRISRIGAFGDDSLQRHFANLSIELRALSDLVIARDLLFLELAITLCALYG